MLEGHSFIVGAAVSIGGRDIKPGINVHRFANRIPLLFEVRHSLAKAAFVNCLLLIPILVCSFRLAQLLPPALCALISLSSGWTSQPWIVNAKVACMGMPLPPVSLCPPLEQVALSVSGTAEQSRKRPHLLASHHIATNKALGKGCACGMAGWVRCDHQDSLEAHQLGSLQDQPGE